MTLNIDNLKGESLTDKQMVDVLNEISYSGLNGLSKWIGILRKYGLPPSKYRTIKRSFDRKIPMGILTDWLMKIANALEIPYIYIIKLSKVRKYYRGIKGSDVCFRSWTHTIRTRTYDLLCAVYEKSGCCKER